MPSTLARITVAFVWPRRMPRMGEAISAARASSRGLYVTTTASDWEAGTDGQARRLVAFDLRLGLVCFLGRRLVRRRDGRAPGQDAFVSPRHLRFEGGRLTALAAFPSEHRFVFTGADFGLT